MLNRSGICIVYLPNMYEKTVNFYTNHIQAIRGKNKQSALMAAALDRAPAVTDTSTVVIDFQHAAM